MCFSQQNSSALSSWDNRLFLVGSNIQAAVPLFYLAKRVRPFGSVLDAFGFTLLEFFASCFYHLCDDTSIEGSFCIASDDLLLAADVILATQLIMVGLLYSIPRGHTAFKSLSYSLFLLVNAVLYYNYPEPDFYDLLVWSAISFAVILVIHIVFRWRLTTDANIDHFVQHHLQPTAAILFAITAVVGLTLRVVGNIYYGLYTPFHSLWHLFVFTAEYFFFRIHDTGGLWTFATMDPCDAAYDVAAMEGDEFDKDCEDVSLAVITGSE